MFTRDDALVIAVVVIAGFVLTLPRAHRRHGALVAVAGVAALVVARWSVRWWMYGALLPNTYTLKVGGVPRTLLAERGAAAAALTLAFGLGVPLALGVTGLRTGAFARTCMGVVAAQLLYSVAVGGDAWENFGFANRFVATALPVLVVAAVLGTIALHRSEVPSRLRSTGLGILATSAVLAVVAPHESVRFVVGDGDATDTALRLVAIALALVGVLLATSRTGLVLLGLTLVLAGNVAPLRSWISDGERIQQIGDRWAATGLALRAATAPGTTIAASGIGNLGYFSDRPIVDELGKIDPVIAASSPRLDLLLVPGHTKWDYQHSIGELRPDVVAHLFLPTDDILTDLRAWGYRPIGPDTWVREGLAIDDEAELERALRASG